VLRIDATEVMEELVFVAGIPGEHASVEPLAMSAVAARIVTDRASSSMDTHPLPRPEA
jgi:hypothetical protein